MPSEAERAELLRVLEPQFKQIEDLSAVQYEYPPGKCPCFRLDGVKASKQHLKNSLTNDAFSKALTKAIETTYVLHRDMLERGTGNFFLCAYSYSDEVSFILTEKRNFFKNRLMKLATTLAGALSAAMTVNFKGTTKTGHAMITVFDARPLILEDTAQVERYLLYRWLIGRRNAMDKVLRLSGRVPVEVLYPGDTKLDMWRLSRLVAQHGLERQVDTLLSTGTLWLPEETRKFVQHHARNEEDLRISGQSASDEEE